MSRNLQKFYLNSRFLTTAKHRSLTFSSIRFQSGIKKVTVIGGGIMGSGIAQVAAQGNCAVVVCDKNEKILDNTRKTISNSLQRIAKKKFKENPEHGVKFIAEVISNISFETKTEKSVENAELIIEAIVEDLDIKHKLFTAIDAVAPESSIFASNTSSLMISSIADAIPKRKSNFVGLHFFNPVPVMKLVEVINIPESSPEVIEKVTSWAELIGKVPVRCKDVPGFIVNQIQIPYLFHAMRLLQTGAVSVEDIDIAIRLGAGHPMGPLELSDYIGLDTMKHTAEHFYEKKSYSPFFVEPPEILKRLVQENKLGIKSGEGFYKYPKEN